MTSGLVRNRRVPISRSAMPPSSGSPCSSSLTCVSRNWTSGCRARKLRTRSGTSQVPSDCWKASATVPVSGDTNWPTAAIPSSKRRSIESTCGLNTSPALVSRSVRPDRRSSGVPTSDSSRASARETPDCVTPSSSETSVTVIPSATR